MPSWHKNAIITIVYNKQQCKELFSSNFSENEGEIGHEICARRS